MQSKTTMASAEFLPFQSGVQVKHEDPLNVPGFSEKGGVQLMKQPQELLPAHLRNQNSTNESQVPSSVQGSIQHPKHVIPFNGLSFHNPFDINSYPLTNPPLYDPSMHIPYGGTRHRRISISNGQIGQIVNHEACFMDEDSFDEFYVGDKQRPTFHDDTFANTNGSGPVNAVGIPGNVAGNQWDLNRTGAAALAPEISTTQPMISTPIVSGEVSEVSAGVTTGANTPLTGAQVKQENGAVAGLPPPNHTLIYNNEVIYNPNDGPIPGTAAWKKERLLKRNRLAASKCRQRKKQAQQQLQHDVSKFETLIKDKEEKLQKYEKLISMYNSALKQHFNGTSNALETLRPFVENPEL